MITENEFSVLAETQKNCGSKALTQRSLSLKTSLSAGTINKVVNNLRKKGLLNELGITQKGIKALEPYKVKRSIFLAAGFGSRLVPITLNTPKPLVRVHGIRMIDSLLDAVLAADINEIVIIRGYLGEQFDQLLSKYPMIRFIDNPLYNETNNISSALLAKDLFSNAYVFESDTILYNKELISPYQYTSNYLVKLVDKTDDWILKTSRGIVTKMERGGVNSYLWYGISHWTAEDGEKLRKYIPELYKQPGGKENLWDAVALDYKKSEFKVRVRICKKNDLIEIDSFKELKEVDAAYRV